MVAVSSVAALLILAGALALVRQRLVQGARGRWTPVAILALLAASFLLPTPVSDAVLAPLAPNAAYLAGHLCALSAIMVTTLYWRSLVPGMPGQRWRPAVWVCYGSVLAVLIYLFATSEQQPHGLGFSRGFEDSPRIQLYWIVQAVVAIPVVAVVAAAAARATARERRSRRGLFGLLLGSAVMFTVYEIWVVVVVVCWPDLPPVWAQQVTYSLQGAVYVLLVGGTIGPVLLGTVRGARLARRYLEELAPLHDWLTTRYPQVRLEVKRGRRAEFRVVDMLVEISDALRLLQHAEPALAVEYRLDDAALAGALEDRVTFVAYELAAARNFRLRMGAGGLRAYSAAC
ncbi:hypothetical protein JK358_30915 [Nocardia sp. 2]|uniref:DUF6545 domain-containing protein n=1 Tax=Nocardia acididurans TaxID=2802282 RepID=A0ABS1MDU4_9NOCA|nr:DUF6545 domain-containing protein [Nocardia acididurans]MBL1078823.1 hypothetical protein [Nocardia acididurans]